jgi:hypothetical protein
MKPKKGILLLVGLIVVGLALLLFKRHFPPSLRIQRQASSAQQIQPAIAQADAALPSGQSANPNLKTIPAIFPGDSLQALREKLGKEKESFPGPYSMYTWELPECHVDIGIDSTGHASSVSIMYKKVPLLTPEGITLGRDTLSQFKTKLGDKVLADQEDLSAGEGLWLLTEVVQSDSRVSLKTSYTWALSESRERENEMLWRHGTPTPAVFASVPVTGYELSSLANTSPVKP